MEKFSLIFPLPDVKVSPEGTYMGKFSKEESKVRPGRAHIEKFLSLFPPLFQNLKASYQKCSPGRAYMEKFLTKIFFPSRFMCFSEKYRSGRAYMEKFRIPERTG